MPGRMGQSISIDRLVLRYVLVWWVVLALWQPYAATGRSVDEMNGERSRSVEPDTGRDDILVRSGRVDPLPFPLGLPIELRSSSASLSCVAAEENQGNAMESVAGTA